ncbi:MAG: hypothetical protein L0Y66_12285 [Myxococcaceae bacterium]|nr:hypothetical protein [Myxococcaceae bacterium]MCI0669617.1 hypothetical protein [Myxococcaceae bacterium]
MLALVLLRPLLFAALAGDAPTARVVPTPSSVRPALEVRHGSTPRVDGVLAPGEWEDARALPIDVAPGWRVTVRVKHDGASLHVAFAGLKHGKEERYPEVLVDPQNDATPAWGADDGWFHASYRDCEGVGRPNVWDCTPQKPGWEANNFPLQEPGVVELRLSLSKLRRAPGSPKPLGLAFAVTDTREAWHLWPAGATLHSPSTWAEASSPDRWNDLGPEKPLRGRVETFAFQSAVLGEQVKVPVYLPAGYTAERRHRALFTLLGPVFFEHPAVQLPRRLEALAEQERVRDVVVVGIPGSSAPRAHHPDTRAAAAFARHVAEELVAEVERRYAVSARREERWLLGFSGGAAMALDLAVRRPELFGRVALVSPGWMDWDGARNDFGRVFVAEALAHVHAASRGRLPELWMGWGDGTLAWEVRSREQGQQVVRALAGRGTRPVVAPAVAGEHGLHLIARTLPEVLRFLDAGRR